MPDARMDSTSSSEKRRALRTAVQVMGTEASATQSPTLRAAASSRRIPTQTSRTTAIAISSRRHVVPGSRLDSGSASDGVPESWWEVPCDHVWATAGQASSRERRRPMMSSGSSTLSCGFF